MLPWRQACFHEGKQALLPKVAKPMMLRKPTFAMGKFSLLPPLNKLRNLLSFFEVFFKRQIKKETRNAQNFVKGKNTCLFDKKSWYCTCIQNRTKFKFNWIKNCWENALISFTVLIPLWPWSKAEATKTGIIWQSSTDEKLLACKDIDGCFNSAEQCWSSPDQMRGYMHAKTGSCLKSAKAQTLRSYLQEKTEKCLTSDDVYIHAHIWIWMPVSHKGSI